ncbi:DUF5361 domain-containing protein [Glutamicibacter creatinolyticus]|uniref:DUF5361 domain-containing protein n=1 Tax=Glutamicibacter creatinolyticus TaxID=162496 RepID=UPI003216C727
MLAIVNHLPTDSAYWRKREPEKSRWGVSEYLLAIIADSLRWLVWSKTKDAKHNRRRPKPIPRPGVDEKTEKKGTFKGAISRNIDEVKRLLSLPRR